MFYIEVSELILIGEIIELIVKVYEEGKIFVDKLYDLEYKLIEEIMELLKKRMYNCVIYGVGNIYGVVEFLIEKIYEYKVK